MACFRMQPFYALPRHRAINHFLMAYHDGWLSYEQSLGVQLIEEITGASFEENAITNVPNGASVAPIAGMAPSSASDGGSAEGTGVGSGSGAGSEAEASASAAKALMEASMYLDSSDEGNQKLEAKITIIENV